MQSALPKVMGAQVMLILLSRVAFSMAKNHGIAERSTLLEIFPTQAPRNRAKGRIAMRCNHKA